MAVPRLIFPLAAAGIFAAGLAVGLITGRSGSSRVLADSAAADAAARKHVHVSSAGGNSAAAASASGQYSATRLVLGDITRVPFQELYGVLSQRSSAELTEVAQQLDQLPAGREADQKVTAFFKVWAQLDATAALRAAANLHAPQSKTSALRAVVQNADAGVAATLASAIKEVPAQTLDQSEKRGLLMSVAEKWSEIDPVAAAKLVDETPGARGGWNGGARRVAENWGAVDPQAALAWAQTHSEGRNGGSAVAGAISGWWDKDPGAAQKYVTEHLNEPGTREAAFSLAGRMFNGDQQRAQDWVNALPDVELRRQMDQMLAGQLAGKDPQRAAAWSATLPDEVRERAMSTAVGEWARSDPAAAAQWIGDLTGTARDQAFSAFSQSAANKDPAGALNWAASISDAGLRGQSTDRIVRRWMQRSPTEATAWVQQSTLPDEQKQRLLNRPVAPPPGG